MEFLAGSFQKPQYVAAGSAVQIAGRFVSKNNGGLGKQGTSDSNTLLLAAGKVVRQIVQLVLQRQHMYYFIHKLFIYLVSVQFHGQYNILVDIQHGNQVVVLKNKADFSPAKNRKLFIIEF